MAIVDFAGYGYKGGAIDFTDYDIVTVTSLPQASEDTMGHIYQVGPDANNNYDRYYTQKSGDTYSWVPMGSTQMDLSGYATVSNLDALSSDVNAVQETLFHKADIDGSYDGMAVGIARNLEGRTDVTDSFFKRTTGGDAEVANGTAQLNEVKGRSQVWNQLTKKDIFDFSTKASVTLSLDEYGDIVLNGTATSDAIFNVITATDRAYLISGHKYYIKGGNSTEAQFNIYSRDLIGAFGIANSIFTALGTGRVVAERIYVLSGVVFDNYKLYPQLFDLTLLGIDNLNTAEEVEAWLAENIGEQAYYPYNAGEVLNNRMTGVESIGFNLLDPATGKADIIGAYSDVYGNYYGITGTHGTLTFTDKFGNTETITPDEDGKFLLETAGTLSVADAGEDCAVFLWWDGTQTEFKPYEKNVGALDVTHIYGKLNGEGEYVRVWPTGMPGIGDIKDSLKVVDGQVVAERKVGEVDMGSLGWSYSDANSNVYAIFSGIKSANCGLSCGKYNTVLSTQFSGKDKAIATNNSGNSIQCRDSSYPNATTFKNANTGVLLYYELATPQVYTDLIYRDSEAFADNTPVTLPVNYKVDNWGIERIAPQNTEEAVVTTKPELTMRYSIDAVEELNTHRDEIDDLYEKNEELDQRKPEKYGEYPDMAVGSAKTLAGNDTKVEDFVFKALDCADGLAKLNSARGKSLVWNQIVQNGNFADGTTGWLAYGDNGNISVSGGILTYSVVTVVDNSYANKIRYNYLFVTGHKYLFAGDIYVPRACSISIAYNRGSVSPVVASVGWNHIAKIYAFESNAEYNLIGPDYLQRNGYEVGDEIKYRNIIAIDLTLMFGAGNEPATVAEFEKMFHLPYYDYNPGEIISNKTEEVKVTGFNLWDEEWESGTVGINARGEYFAAVKASSTSQIRTKNWIGVVPGKTYRFSCLTANYGGFYVVGANYIIDEGQGVSIYASPILARNGGETLTIPSWCHYILFSMAAAYGTTYNHDICINLSDPARNGEYEPYKTNTIELNLPTLTGKLNGEGESVVVFPDGLKSVGSVYDEIVGNKAIKRVKVVSLSEQRWVVSSNQNCFRTNTALDSNALKPDGDNQVAFVLSNKYIADTANELFYAHVDKAIGLSGSGGGLVYCRDTQYADVESFVASLGGLVFMYALATPEEYILDAPLPDTFQAYKGGTIKQLPENTSVPVTAPMVMTVTYAIDAVGTLVGLPRNYVSKESLQAMLNAMQSAGIIASYTMTYNENTGKYDFTFVAPTNS